MRKGGILLSVHADDQEWASKGKQIREQRPSSNMLLQWRSLRAETGDSWTR